MKRLMGTEAGIGPASTADLFRAHGVLIAALPEDLPAQSDDDDDEVWIELIATTVPETSEDSLVPGIAHEDMAELLNITLEAWLSPIEIPDIDDDDDCIDWEH